MYNVWTMPVFSIYEEDTHIFPLLTHLEPTIRVGDGQIPPDTVTHPWQPYSWLETILNSSL